MEVQFFLFASHSFLQLCCFLFLGPWVATHGWKCWEFYIFSTWPTLCQMQFWGVKSVKLVQNECSKCRTLCILTMMPGTGPQNPGKEVFAFCVPVSNNSHPVVIFSFVFSCILCPVVPHSRFFQVACTQFYILYMLRNGLWKSLTKLTLRKTP